MAIRLPGPVVLLTGEDCAALNKVMGELVVALRRRDGYVPQHLVELVEEVRRAAIQFRMNTLVEPDSGTAFDAVGSGSRASGVSERLSATEAARLSGVSREMICRLAFKGVLKGTRTGWRGAWVLDAGSVATWQASRTERANKAA